MFFISRQSWLASVLILICAPLSAQPATNLVVIVKSSENAYFNQTVEALSKHAEPGTRFETVLAEDRISTAGPRLYIALGQRAVDRVATLPENVPVINAYLTLEQFHRLPEQRQMTVLLDQPLHRYLAFSKFVMYPETIGIVNETAIRLNHEEVALLENLDLTLNQYQLSSKTKLLPALRKLLTANDALLMLPRQSIYNRDSLKGVLLASYRGRKPVISYSPAHVKSGALASIYSSPVDIGRHISILMNKLLRNQPLDGSRFRFARFYSIALNPSVARALDLELPSEFLLRKQLDELEP